MLIRVRAAGVNKIDISTRNGNLARAGLLARSDRYFLGWDVSGEIAEVGDGVTRWSPGDLVVGLRDVLSAGGTQADFVVLSESAIAPAPRSISLEDAGGFPLVALTAARSLAISGLRRGENLLVTGAAGGVGHHVIELAALAGIAVVAQADSADAPDLLGRGAVRVIDRRDHIASAVRDDLTDGVDAVIDAAVLGVSAHEALRGGGRFVALVAPFAPPPIRGTTVVVQEVWADGDELTRLSALVDSGALQVRVGATYGLDAAAEAHAVVERGGLRGRVLLVP